MHIVNLHNSYHASNVPSSSKSSYVSALTTDNTPLALNKTARPHYLVGLVTIGVLSALGGSGFQAAAIQQTVEALEQCAFSAGLVATAQTHLVYRGLVMAGLMYHLVLSIDTARLHNAAHTTALILNSFLRTVFQGIQIYQNQHWLQWTAELNCTGPASSIILDYASLALVTLFFLLEIFYCCWWRRQAFSWATDKSESTGATPVVAATSVISLMKLNVYYLFEFSAQLAPMTALHYPLMNIYEAIVVPISGALIAIVAWYVLTSETAPDRSDGGVPCGFALTSTTIERRRRAWLIGIVGLYCLSVAYFSYRVVLLASPVPLPWNDSYRVSTWDR
ncbi:hypothetical protein BX666DRAFT_194981 [Dichotomocladium elegans]|nr:hypothetical protein BX666DRAFT_194981 [Dichotomocladium elegans]